MPKPNSLDFGIIEVFPVRYSTVLFKKALSPRDDKVIVTNNYVIKLANLIVTTRNLDSRKRTSGIWRLVIFQSVSRLITRTVLKINRNDLVLFV